MSTAVLNRKLCALLLSCALALVGCSAPPPSTDASSAQIWAGRLGLLVHDPLAAEKSVSVSFHLQGSAQQGLLQIFTPFGSQIAELQWQPGMATLHEGPRTTESTSLDALLERSLGTDLPIHALFGWLQGQYASAQGWSVNLQNYAAGKITAERLHPAPAVTLRIVLQQPE